MIRFKRKNFLIIFLGFLFLITSGLGCRCSSSKETESVKPVNLVYWRESDGRDAFSVIIQEFQRFYPHITITYKAIRPEEYEQALLEAWAEDHGPDIFSVSNTWLGKYQTKILPLNFSEELSLSRKIVQGTLKKEEKIVVEKKYAPSLRDLREIFVETVSKDVVVDNKIYGLPLALDILALYYNRDLLNSAGIVSPPETWDEFMNDVSLLTLQDRSGNFIQAGAAFGTANNVNYLTDIVSLLMMQNGTEMVNANKQASFNRPLPGDNSYLPGQEAVKFYTGFANPYQEGIYTWDEQMPDSLTAFIQGKVGFFFGYAKDIPLIKGRAPKINFDIAPVPQITGSLKEINYAQYLVETVSKKTLYPQEAWSFVIYAIQNENARTFVERVKKPTAHRALIKEQLEDFDLAPFAKSVLTAQTWYQGKNYSLVEESFKEMVQNVLLGDKTVREAIDYCVQKVNLTY